MSINNANGFENKEPVSGYDKVSMGNFFKKILRSICRNFGRVYGTICRVTANEPIAALTFDDGPDPVYTAEVLGVLKEFNVRGTFFMVGQSAEAHPDIVNRVAREGHAIGNHSWNHYSFPLISSLERWEQIKKCENAIRPYSQKLLRFPYGMTNKRCKIEAMLMGFKIIGWSVSSDDWWQADSRLVAGNIISDISPGSIILMHDRLFDMGRPIKGPKNDKEAYIDREPMIIALREILVKLKGKFAFVTIPELLQHANIQ